ncbi:AMP-binding protein [Vibrio algivorus]|uniref:Long-chain-fatty-acid--CoA ligase n=1 Tax=Vibrio algivorus TaxID=1667024 RepID=A0ABQ6ENS7_9VIBR|nr:AMP-binding protein [Vibrio algivorus]GLT14763.1 long-chain-fatty-acid--CoA ligase [Vibrio algivorus]
MSNWQSILQHQNLVQFIESTCVSAPEKQAYQCLGKGHSYAEIEQLSTYFAQWIQHESDLQPGDRIAIQLPNLTQYPIVAYGALKAGLIIVNTNPLYTPREMHHQFNDSGAKALIILEDLLPKYEAIKDKIGIEQVIVTRAADLLKVTEPTHQYFDLMSLLEQGKSLPEQLPIQAKPDDIAVLQYTGGTTGVAKGASLTHANILTNASQMAQRLEQLPPLDGGSFICPLPLYHIYAFTVNMVALFGLGVTNTLIPNPRDIAGFVETLKSTPFIGMSGINTLFVGLCQHPEFKDLDFSNFKLTISGGSALNSSTFNLWKKVTGCTITEGWGLSETSPVLTLNEFGQQQPGSVGTPLGDTDIQVWNEDNQPLPQGEVGELVIKGPQVMKGYWNRPEDTEKSIINGYFLTGDVGLILPNGAIQIVDRMKDMIIVSGFNVYPNEIEEVLCQHPEIIEAAVVGEEDEKTGEKVVAHLVTTLDSELTEKDIETYCRENLAAYKVPRKILFLKELPKSTVGKVLRRELRTA